MNKNITDGTWKELKGKLRSEWGKLTDDELEQSKGNLEQIAGKIEQHYGVSKAQVNSKINAFLEDFNNKIS